MVLKCDFTLDKESQCYTAGEKVEGTVELTVHAPVSIKNISVKLQGEASVCFVENLFDNHANCDSDDSHDSKHCPNKNGTEFTGEDLFVDFSQNLSDYCELEPGEYSYKFCFKLPNELLSTIELDKGSVEYFLMLVVRKGNNKVEKFRHSIDVEEIYDLNTDLELREPQEVQHVKSLNWLNLSSGKINFVLSTPQGAYVPSEILRYKLSVDNRSSTDVKGFKAFLKMTVIYSADDPYEREYTEIYNVVEEEYDDECPGCTKQEFEYDFEIPRTAPSTDEDQIIYINYSLDVTVNLSGLTCDVDMSLPLDIGTVPFTNSAGSTTATQATPALTAGPAPAQPGYQPYAGAPPPGGYPQYPGPPPAGYPQYPGYQPYTGAPPPAGYPGGPPPAGYPGGPPPAGYPGGPPPAGYPGGPPPAGYPGGPPPAGYAGVPPPAGYAGGPPPAGYPQYPGPPPAGYPAYGGQPPQPGYQPYAEQTPQPGYPQYQQPPQGPGNNLYPHLQSASAPPADS